MREDVSEPQPILVARKAGAFLVRQGHRRLDAALAADGRVWALVEESDDPVGFPVGATVEIVAGEMVNP